jgi:hypothetical protein
MFRAVRFLAPACLACLSLTATAVAAPVRANPKANGQVSLVKPLTLQRQADMDFGSLAVTTGGTATIDPRTGQMTLTGGLTQVGGQPSPARYIGAADRLSLIVIRNLTPSISLQRLGGTETLTLNGFTLDGPSIRIVGTRPFEFAVGGRLTVPAGTVDGLYTGEINITAEYF